MDGTAGQDMLGLVESKVKDVLGCRFPAKFGRLLGDTCVNHRGLVSLWMCPAREKCGKTGGSPTGRFCCDVDYAFLSGESLVF
jgi:hypothetical protein